MSAAEHAAHGEHLGPGHLTAKGYLIGFVLAAALTAIPFWLVMNHVVSPAVAAVAVMGLAAVQVVVHMVYFLHMDARSEGGWNLLALLFTALLVGIVLTGSLWVMHHLDVNMMPMTPQEMRQAP
ncbi:cytochrome o ubiquinol oxidase subunit IV [Phenylobacterium montanum]|uniref:Cytochrome bo(3) ubiquinol oxidase subunit 4 n=1 Tax=Phenylobacterium montanum TaxID=2823693 RepID=A0A975G2N0_9CAUL|nr:cytochrome o ubiquinol oxidase subunit IV [Caulobacter sp. S6]QUD89659.1 cytochrome o ubiquinol oxidase subunit IV [Caulobacter sp. S6]